MKDLKRILLADDCQEVLTIILDCVPELSGYTKDSFTVAHGESEAYQAMAKQNFDLIVTDLSMGNQKSGLNICRKSDCPIILLSGDPDILSINEKLEFSTVMRKPFSVAELTNAIINLIGY